MDFAQEFLRRNPDYRGDWRRRDSRRDDASLEGGLARQWGLARLFRSRPNAA
ncbi:DUF6499 domain-containing protein [Sphingomonas sp. RT2P30]